MSEKFYVVSGSELERLAQCAYLTAVCDYDDYGIALIDQDKAEAACRAREVVLNHNGVHYNNSDHRIWMERVKR